MKKWLLPLILFLAFLLRVIALDRYPVGFTPDEASFGYDAYSILKTGKDQWGHKFPLVLESFGDGKLPLYTYLAIPGVAIFGLNEFSTRLPSAMIGVLAVVAVYLLTLKLFNKRSVALLASLFLTFSPWHLSLSRGAFESNLTVFFLTFAVWAFLSKKYKLASLFFGLNLFSYHSARLITPIIVFALWFWKRHEFDFKKNILSVFIFSTFLIVSLATLLTGGASRAGDVTIFNPTDKWQSVYDDRYGAVFSGEPYFWAKIFNNKITYIFDQFTNAYSTYLSPQFLFTLGAAETTYGMVPGVGVLYLFESVFLMFLIYKVLSSNSEENKSVLFLIFWILISIIPASLTKGPGYAANRAALMMPAIQILSSLGTVYLYDFFKNKFKKLNPKIYIFVFGLIYIISILSFLEDYFYNSPRKMAEGMLFGREEALSEVKKIEKNYKNIIVSRSLSEPQIYVAFYNLIDPKITQESSVDWKRYKEAKLPFLDQLGEYRLGKYIFKNIDFSNDSKIPDTLLVGKPGEFPSEIMNMTGYVTSVNYQNLIPAIIIYSSK